MRYWLDCDLSKASKWVKHHVFPKLPPKPALAKLDKSETAVVAASSGVETVKIVSDGDIEIEQSIVNSQTEIALPEAAASQWVSLCQRQSLELSSQFLWYGSGKVTQSSGTLNSLIVIVNLQSANVFYSYSEPSQ